MVAEYSGFLLGIIIAIRCTPSRLYHQNICSSQEHRFLTTGSEASGHASFPQPRPPIHITQGPLCSNLRVVPGADILIDDDHMYHDGNPLTLTPDSLPLMQNIGVGFATVSPAIW